MTSASHFPANPNGWAFFLDFDGTLIDIADTPEAVAIPPDLPGLLMRLADRADGAVALVSGRPMESLDRLLAPVRLPSAGIHGADMRLPGGHLEMLVAPELEALRDRLRALGVGAPELLVEEKSVSVTIHYRRRPELEPSLRAAILAIISGSPGLTLQPGKMILEVHPAGADKGRALTRFMEQPPFAGRRPLAIGDDLSDEHMFQVAEKMGGLAVKVGIDRRKTAATAHFADTPSVRAWLSKLAAYPR